MGFMSWLTGRDEKESDVYANYDKVESVVSNIKSISTNQVESARDAVHSAVNNLNNVNGLAQFVGSVDAGAFDGVFESIASAIVQIGDQVQNKANDIKTYEESAWYEKLGSTFAMAGAKFGEGVLSVAEDIGDGVVSVAGWIAPKDSGFEKACEDFVKKEWSHDAFNFYYDSEYAKKSTFTEDSAAAAGFKIAGATTGYLYLGGAISGFAGEMKGANTATKAVKTFASSTTKVNTTTAALSGMGSGTESGLRQGKSFDAAAWGGFKQGAAQGAIAYGVGKLGERNAKDEAIKKAQKAYDDAEEEAYKLVDEVKSGKLLQSEDAFKTRVADIKAKGQAAQDALENANNTKFQGYNDAITKSGQKAGATYAQNIGEKGFVKGTVKTLVTDPAKAGVAGAKNLGGKAVKTFKSDPGTTLSTSTVDGASSSGSTALSTTVDGASSSGSTVANTAKNTKLTLKEAGTKVVKNVATSTSAPGVIGAAANAAGREMVSSKGNAAEQFRKSTTTIDKTTGDAVKINSDVNYTPGKQPIVGKDNSQPTGNTNNGGGGSTGGATGRSSSGISSSGGGYSGGGGSYSGGGTTIAATTSGTEQFRHNTDASDKTDNENNNKKNTDATTNNNNNNNSNSNNNNNNDKTPSTPTGTPNTTTSTTPSGDNNTTTVVTKPSNPGTNTTQHTGGGYSGSSGYRGSTGVSSNTSGGNSGAVADANTPTSPIEDVTSDTTTSIDDVIKGSKYTKIPTSSNPISTTSSSGSGGSTVIPVVAGLSAAAAAGIGAKVYMDRKKNNENGEYDEIDTEEWAGEDTINLDYDESSDTETYLDEDDDYGYQAEEQTERYDARNNEELADLQ